METNNLTPDENLKRPTDYNPYNDYDEIIHPMFREAANNAPDDEGVVIADPMSDDEIAESGAVIVYLFTTVFVIAIGVLLYYLL